MINGRPLKSFYYLLFIHIDHESRMLKRDTRKIADLAKGPGTKFPKEGSRSFNLDFWVDFVGCLQSLEGLN